MRATVHLMQYEIESLRWVAENFELEEDIVQGFGESLNALAVFYLGALTNAPEHREGRVVMMGLLNHAHHLLAGGLQSLESGNANIWSACVRGLIEVFGATVLIREQPGKVVNHLGQLSAGKLYSAAARMRPGFKDDLERLHSAVHPGSSSMYAGVEPTDYESREVRLEFGLRRLKKEEGREAVIVLANMARLLEESFRDLATDSKVLSTGCVVMRTNGQRAGSPFV
jgi:hypothetical protein